MVQEKSTKQKSREWALLFEKGQIAYPKLILTEKVFVAYWRDRLEEEADLESLPGIDLFLACACASRIPGAVAQFESTYAKDIRGILERYTDSKDVLEDTAQTAVTHLLVAEPGLIPKISQYKGKSVLLAFVRVVVTREALKHFRQKKIPLKSKITCPNWLQMTIQSWLSLNILIGRDLKKLLPLGLKASSLGNGHSCDIFW